MHARHAGSHSFLAAIQWCTTLTRPESFLQNGPIQLLQSFFDRLPDHQADIERGSTHPTHLESEVDHFSKALQMCMVDVTSNPALMPDFKSRIEGIPTIDLTTKEVAPDYPPLKGNNAEDPEDDLDMPTTALGHLSYQHTVHDESFSSAAPIHADSGGAQAMPSTSVLRNILTASLVMDKQEFSPRSIDRLKALISTEDRTQTLIKVGTEEATTCFNAHTSQDEASYDGDISEADGEDVEVIPDKVDDAQTQGSKLAGADTLPDSEGQEATNKEDDGKTSKHAGKKPVQKCIATGHHLILEMVQFVMTKTFSLRVKGTNILKTTSPFIACSGQAEYFSCIPSICSKRARRVQTSTSTWMLFWLMDQLCRVVSGQAYPGILTHLKLELLLEICLGS